MHGRMSTHTRDNNKGTARSARTNDNEGVPAGLTCMYTVEVADLAMTSSTATVCSLTHFLHVHLWQHYDKYPSNATCLPAHSEPTITGWQEGCCCCFQSSNKPSAGNKGFSHRPGSECSNFFLHFYLLVPPVALYVLVPQSAGASTALLQCCGMGHEVPAGHSLRGVTGSISSCARRYR